MANITNPNYVPVDPIAIRNALSQKNISLSKASELMGYQQDYLSNCLSPAKGNVMLIRNALALCAICGVELSDIQPKDPPPTAEPPIEVTPPVDYKEQLDKIIFRLATINTTLAELVSVYRRAWIDKED